MYMHMPWVSMMFMNMIWSQEEGPRERSSYLAEAPAHIHTAHLEVASPEGRRTGSLGSGIHTPPGVGTPVTGWSTVTPRHPSLLQNPPHAPGIGFGTGNFKRRQL